MSRNKLHFKNKHEKGEIVKPNFVTEKTQYNEAIAAPLKGGGYSCYTFKNPQQKIEKNNRHIDRYVSKRKAISSNFVTSCALLGQFQ